MSSSFHNNERHNFFNSLNVNIYNLNTEFYFKKNNLFTSLNEFLNLFYLRLVSIKYIDLILTKQSLHRY